MLVLYALIVSALLSGCSFGGYLRGDQYNVDALAKDWRKQVRETPYNPYERHNDYKDNDCSYYPGSYKQGVVGKNRYKKNAPTQNYRKYWYYDPEEDNFIDDPRYYPLYFDN
jgi:hypothetical protein